MTSIERGNEKSRAQANPLIQRDESIRQRGVPQIGRPEFVIGRVILVVPILNRGLLRVIDVAAYSSQHREDV